MPQHEIAFKKESAPKRMVWAEVYTPDVPDSDGEFMRAEEIEKMAYGFMRSMKLDAVDHMHDNIQVDGACVIESFIARKGDPDFNEGAWVVGMHIDNDETWDKVEKGEINGFSMEALVHKTVLEVELETPPVLAGKTMIHKTEGSEDAHDHDFMVAYGDDGRFLGGKTSPAGNPPHVHVIKRGTLTEEAAGHSHRFAHVDQVKIK